ncbi:MAG: biopolymer transporter ExbD [Pedosphaera sp.]|nr:biopolymer transporter ExbD [Pedosphaera sp.]
MGELNITPLLDLAFVLLVVFIITTAPSTNDIDINLPSAGQQPPQNQSKQDINNVTVDSAGNIFFNAEPITLKKLEDTIIAFRKTNPDLSVVVRGDENVNYQKVVQVLDILVKANVTNIGLATDTAGAAN